MNDLPEFIFSIKDPDSFHETALEIFRIQADRNPVFKNFITSLGRSKERVKDLSEITFLPIEFFRDQKIILQDLPLEVIFESSRTTGTIPGRHFVHDLKMYERSFQSSFAIFYGDPSEYFIAALLPSYSERGNSSLVYMMDHLIRKSRYPGNNFYNNRMEDLVKDIEIRKEQNVKILLMGVSFALLSLAERLSPDLSGVIVMETGGMKGRRKEITREELHKILVEKMNVPVIHSEYGMTELLSQAYSKGNGIFRCPPWMRIMIRDPHDPLSIIKEPGHAGGINIIDLANLYSCSFIATGDMGRLHADGSFEVLGRFDNSDIRGCNLMVE
ncbi:MAG: acyl transferase [Bacteroidota bacterium]|nr:acyl transferase [Bacteroidota bacterium]